jgi:hypothetical protein
MTTRVTLERDGAWAGDAFGVAQATRHLTEVLPRVMANDDDTEGVSSLVERRKARFTGR